MLVSRRSQRFCLLRSADELKPPVFAACQKSIKYIAPRERSFSFPGGMRQSIVEYATPSNLENTKMQGKFPAIRTLRTRTEKFDLTQLNRGSFTHEGFWHKLSTDQLKSKKDLIESSNANVRLVPARVATRPRLLSPSSMFLHLGAPLPSRKSYKIKHLLDCVIFQSTFLSTLNAAFCGLSENLAQNIQGLRASSASSTCDFAPMAGERPGKHVTTEPTVNNKLLSCHMYRWCSDFYLG